MPYNFVADSFHFVVVLVILVLLFGLFSLSL